MPELPDVTVYVERIAERICGQSFQQLRLGSPFVLRSVAPRPQELQGREVARVFRIGKRIVIELTGKLFIVIHLMIAGRLHWKERGAKIPGKVGLAAFDFPTGTLTLTEASSKKRASIHLVTGDQELLSFDRGGVDVFEIDVRRFSEVLRRENHTLKRALTDPRLFSGIGNAYSDEILYSAKLSPVRLSRQMSDEEICRLFDASREVLREWTERLRRQSAGDFPEGVTAFREEMAVHGKYRQPCPICKTFVQRIVYAENETNYCPRCQTEGKLLADRSLSRLLKEDWPKTIDELEEKRGHPSHPSLQALRPNTMGCKNSG